MKKLILLGSMICCFLAMAAIQSSKSILNPDKSSRISVQYHKNFDRVLDLKSPSVSISSVTAEDVSDELVYSVSSDPGNPVDALRFNGLESDDRVYLAFCLESNEIRNYIGAEISSINITSGTSYEDLNPIKNVTVFITKDLGTEPIIEQKAELGDASFTVNSIALDTPYKIDNDSPLYIGYYFTCGSDDAFYLPFDGERSDRPSNLYAFGRDSWPESWDNMAPENGNLCISVTLKGESLPKNCAVISTADFPESSVPGNEFGYWITVTNKGTSAIHDLEIETEINGVASYYNTTLDEPAQKITLFISGLITVDSGIFNMKSRITKVNGVENIYSSDSKVSRIACYSGGFQQNAVVEEATGTWCGYCPSGIVMCEYIRDNYEDRIFPIAVHQGDRMELEGYQDFINEFVTGFPTAVANRKEDMFVGIYGAERLYDQIKDKNSYCGVSLSAKRVDDTLNIDAVTEFALNTNLEHRLSFVVVEDGVGPYLQTNYYGPGSGLGKWDSAGGSVLTYFNDVARCIETYHGIEGSLPSVVESGEKYPFSYKMNVSSVTSSVFRVIAFITDVDSGEIVNSAQYTVAPEGEMYINKTELNMRLGESVKLTAVIAGEDMTDKSVDWSSSDESIATVDNSGSVTACGPGEAVVTASCDGKKAASKVSVSLIGGIVMCDDIRYQIVDGSSCSVAMPEIEGNYLMENVVIPPSIQAFGNDYTVTSLLQGAFSLCGNLKSVVLPPTITVLDGWAFNGCTGLKGISIPENVWMINTCAFQSCGELEKVELKEGLNVIWYNAFAYCGSLPEIELPESLSEIGANVFVGCDNLKNIKCKSAYPPITYGSIFGDSAYKYEDCILWVPSQSVDLYKKDRFWGMFENIKGMESEDSVDGISAEESTFDVYSMDGTVIMRGMKTPQLQNSLASGIYILRYANGVNKKIMVP